MKQHIVRIVLGLVIVVVFVGHAARFYNIGLITQLDNIIYDTRLRLTMPGTVDERVVILDIDEKSLGKLGRWPWSRDKLAGLIDKLFSEYGVAIIGFDVVFAEADDGNALALELHEYLFGLVHDQRKDIRDDRRRQFRIEGVAAFGVAKRVSNPPGHRRLVPGACRR